MNTITIEYNNTFITTFGIEKFQETIQLFRNKAKNGGLTSAEHILYNMVRNLPLNRGFTPTTNKIKLANGQKPNEGFNHAKRSIQYSLKSNDAEMLKKFKLPEVSKDYWLELLAK